MIDLNIVTPIVLLILAILFFCWRDAKIQEKKKKESSARWEEYRAKSAASDSKLRAELDAINAGYNARMRARWKRNQHIQRYKLRYRYKKRC